MSEKSLEEKLKEALEILEKQSKKIQELEEELKKYKVVENTVESKPLPISKITTETELSNDIRKDIEKAVDLILQYASKIPYLQ